jgi:hypothetical protein
MWLPTPIAVTLTDQKSYREGDLPNVWLPPNMWLPHPFCHLFQVVGRRALQVSGDDAEWFHVEKGWTAL